MSLVFKDTISSHYVGALVDEAVEEIETHVHFSYEY